MSTTFQTQSDASPTADIPERSAVSPMVRNLVAWLDSGITVPGTKYQVGMDGIIGLLPGIGDFAGVALGLVVVGEGIRLKLSFWVIVKMLWNLLLDGTLGSIPVAGDLFDFVFKAHKRNYELLEKHAARKHS